MTTNPEGAWPIGYDPFSLDESNSDLEWHSIVDGSMTPLSIRSDEQPTESADGRVTISDRVFADIESMELTAPLDDEDRPEVSQHDGSIHTITDAWREQA